MDFFPVLFAGKSKLFEPLAKMSILKNQNKDNKKEIASGS